MQHSELTEAVKKLRLALGKTQEAFAHRLGTAKSSLVRYESTRPPHGKILAQLSQLAEENNQPQLMRVFDEALAEELGDNVRAEIACRNDEEREYVLALLAAFRNEQYSSDLAVVKQRLKPARDDCRRQLAGFKKADGRIRAAMILLDEGRTPESVAHVLGIQIEQVEQIAVRKNFFDKARRAGLVKEES